MTVPNGAESSSKWYSKWADSDQGRHHEDRILLLLTLIIGAVVGLVVVAFIVLTENLGARMYPAGGAPWRRLVLPVLGALVTGPLLFRYFPNARGSGIPQTKAALFLRDGRISLRTVLGKFGLCSVSLATGMALGREGPSVHVGAGIASVIGRRLGLSPSRVKALVPVGASAALAAAFNTPIAAVLFSLEEVMGDLHAPVLGSIVLSSATSWIVLHLLLGDEPLFYVPAYQLVHPIEFLIYALLGVVGGLVSVSFVKLLLWLRLRFQRMPASTQWIQPAVGGLLVGALGWYVPAVLGVGYGNVSLALNGQIALGTMALLVVLKVAATATCYASGNAGGIFGPALFMGAMTGGALGGAAHLLLPDYTGSIGAYALVGMGAAFAGIIRVPLTSVIMIFEITRDYSIIVPLMIANLISYYISTKLQKEPIYEALQHQDGVYLPEGARDRNEVVLVSRALHPMTATLKADDTVAAAAAQAEQKHFAIIGKGGLLGMVTGEQLQRAIEEGRGSQSLAALALSGESFGRPGYHYPYVHSDHPLDTAMQLMSRAGVEVLPVVSRTDLRELVGVVTLPDILTAYGFGDGERPPEKTTQELKSPVAKLVTVVTVMVGLLFAAVTLSYYYRSQRNGRALKYFQAGNEFVQQERFPEAIEQYRNALSISHTDENRLALGIALVKAGSLPEAQVYLREVLRDKPTSGPANVALAGAFAAQGQLDAAVTCYHQAIYGAWPDHQQENRVQARMELAKALGAAGRDKQAQVELLAILQDLPPALEVRKRVAKMLFDFGMYRESAEVYRSILQRDKDDADAFTGLGDAEVAQGSYVAARDAFKHALATRPSDEALQKKIAIGDRVLAMDPTMAGLHAAERYRRSRDLLSAVLAAEDQCQAAHPEAALSDSLTAGLDSARKQLAQQRLPASYGDATDDYLSLVKQLWSVRPQVCVSGSDEAVSRIVDRIPAH